VALEAALRLAPCCRFILGVDTFDDAAFYRARPLDEIAARRRVFEQDFAGAMRDMVARITAEPADPAIVSEIAAAMSASDKDVALRVLEALLAWDIEARWPLLPCPVETINSAWLARGSEPIALDGLKVHAMEGVGTFRCWRTRPPSMRWRCRFSRGTCSREAPAQEARSRLAAAKK